MWLPPTFAVGTNFVEALKTTLIWRKVKFEIQLFPNLCSNSDNIGERKMQNDKSYFFFSFVTFSDMRRNNAPSTFSSTITPPSSWLECDKYFNIFQFLYKYIWLFICMVFLIRIYLEIHLCQKSIRMWHSD